MLSEVVSYGRNTHVARSLIRRGKVRVNGVTCLFDGPLQFYDIIEVGEKKLCFLGNNWLIEGESNQNGY